MISFESYHLKRAALCEFFREDGELAVGEEGDLEFVETRDVFREAGEWVVGEVEDLKGVEEGEDFSRESVEIAG